MSWTDQIAVETIKKLRDRFGVKTFVETGTFKGINARLHANNFNSVWTCEVNKNYFFEAKSKLKKYGNIYIRLMNSPEFLKTHKFEFPIYYLDAHFYDKYRNNKFVVLEELDELKGNENCIVIIHDFDNHKFGHICYDGQSLNLPLLYDRLIKVNPNFKFYTNTKCEVYNQKTILNSDIEVDEDVIDNIIYANQSKEKRDRGILYCLPRKVDIPYLKEMKIKIKDVGVSTRLLTWKL